MVEPFVEKFQAFFLVLARLSSMFFVAPFFGGQTIPARVRAALALFLSLIIFPLVEGSLPDIPQTVLGYGFTIFNEVIVGLIIGFAINMVFTTFQLAAQFFSIQIGFGIISVVDPMSREELLIIGQIFLFFGLLIFILIDGPYLLIKTLADSFGVLPAINFSKIGALQEGFIRMIRDVFVLAFRIGSPIIGIIFLVEVSLGFVAKAAPQANLLIIGFPIKILIGIAGVMLIAPLMVPVFGNVLKGGFATLRGILEQLR
ncbi:MAG: flagellar biosynthetic protein FliR [bacterium]